MDQQVLKDVIIDQRALRVLPSPLVPRTIHADLPRLKQSKQVVIISGIRRCGKSVLLEKIREESSECDYVINFDDDRLVNFQLEDFQVLYELFIELYGPQKTFYFDEIQNIPGWERFIRRLSDAGNKIYITGSNASLLSAELGTRLTGRYLEIHLYPYSFIEFLKFKQLKLPDLKKLTTMEKGLLKSNINAFLKLGGMPEYLEFENTEYLHNLYTSIIYRDIIVRYNINNHQAVKELVYYLASHIGKECSYNGLKKILGLSSPSTVSEYCGYLQNSFLCYLINRFDYSLKKQIQYPKKIYFIDSALAVNVGFRFSKDEGRLLENIVFLELKRRGHEIYFHKDKKECDFVLRNGVKIISAIQVCLEMENSETENREMAGLIEAMETYELTSGLIITQDTFLQKIHTIDGKTFEIKVVPIWFWLLDV